MVMGHRYTEFLPLPTSINFSKPTRKGTHLNKAMKQETGVTLGEDVFNPEVVFEAMVWFLMRHPLKKLPNPNYHTAFHYIWCYKRVSKVGKCEFCCDNKGKWIRFDPAPVWYLLFLPAWGEDRYYRLSDLDEQILSLRETVGEIQDFLSKKSGSYETEQQIPLSAKPERWRVVEYEVPGENREILYTETGAKRLETFLTYAITLLEHAKTAKEQWGDEAVLYVQPDN